MHAIMAAYLYSGRLGSCPLCTLSHLAYMTYLTGWQKLCRGQKTQGSDYQFQPHTDSPLFCYHGAAATGLFILLEHQHLIRRISGILIY